MVLSEIDAGKNLTAAASRGNVKELRRMLEEQHVHPDTVNEFGRTALQAMMMGSTSVACLLLEHGANANVQDRLGVTPAHDAARAGFVDTLQIMVQFGASVNTQDNTGALPIHVAIREGHIDVVEFLAPRSNLNHQDTSGYTALDVARALRCPGLVELLERQFESSLKFQA
ncbi:cyclin-dependent kinase 4 inhibitor D-like [Conger conger]|uniref:cyclin-dependent kinase 4 inhibitor D-like n=1 Tax=Conger conger TaxID=82655 RepID=UPI002A5A2321|nr:cyclin-dependent kinase 4 inhibitor D-like [Conger conger]